MSLKLSIELWFTALEDGGGTFGRRSEAAYDGEGYVIGGYTETLKLRQETRTIEAIEKVAEWLDKTNSTYVGSWLDDGIVHIDGCDIRYDREQAIELGRELNQLAIYDLKKGEDIRLV